MRHDPGCCDATSELLKRLQGSGAQQVHQQAMLLERWPSRSNVKNACRVRVGCSLTLYWGLRQVTEWGVCTT